MISSPSGSSGRVTLIRSQPFPRPRRRDQQPSVDAPGDRSAVRLRVVLGRVETQQRERRREEHDPARVGRVDDPQQAKRDLREPAPVRAGQALEVFRGPDPVELLARQGDLRLLLGRHGTARLPIGFRRLDQLHAREVFGLRHSNSMSTVSPASSVPSPAGMRARAPAPSIEVRTCDCCALVGATTRPSASSARRTRIIWSRRGLRFTDSARRAVRAPGLRTRTLQRAQRGPCEELEGDHRRDGVARQPEHQRRPAGAEPGRLAGLEAHPPEALLDAELGQRRLDVVVRADRHAAAHADHVRRVERSGERRSGRAGVVRDVAALEHDAARPLGLRRDGIGVRIPDLPWGERSTRLHQLVAGREHSDPGPRYARQTCRAERGEHGELGRADLGSRREDGLPGAYVLARAPNVRALGRGGHRHRAVHLRSVRSTGTTANVPGGTTAPVEIWHAVPGASAPEAGAPARDSPSIVRVAASPAGTANPSIAEASNGGRSSPAATSSASTRPSASASCTCSEPRGWTAARTRSRASSIEISVGAATRSS